MLLTAAFYLNGFYNLSLWARATPNITRVHRTLDHGEVSVLVIEIVDGVRHSKAIMLAGLLQLLLFKDGVHRTCHLLNGLGLTLHNSVGYDSVSRV